MLCKSFKKALEVLEDSPTEGLFESMRTLSGVGTEEELFSDYKLFERSLRQLGHSACYLDTAGGFMI